MAGGFLSQIDWGGTFKFMALRIIATSIVILAFFVVSGAAAETGAGLVLVLLVPVVVVILAAIALGTAWLSQVGVPFAGVFSLCMSIPFFVGDFLIWLSHKIRPEWVVIAEPRFFNAPVAWILKGYKLVA
jgi:hypothetical protein